MPGKQSKVDREPGDLGAVVMLGMGWFPSEVGGLNRYFRGLLGSMPEADAVVVSAAKSEVSPVGVAVPSGLKLPLRLIRYARAASGAAKNASLIDSHFSLYTAVPLALNAFRGRVLVVHFHGPWAQEAAVNGDGGRVLFKVRHWLEAYVYRHADLLITLTGAFKAVLVSQYGVPPWKVDVVPPGVDDTWFTATSPDEARAGLGLPSTDFVAICVRRLVPRMGLFELVTAWESAFGARSDCHLLIVGDGALRQDLESRIAHLDVGGVRTLGRVSDDELRGLYAAADVNVMPSVALEGYGLPVLEAAAAGTPSIVSDVGGLPEAVAGMGERLVVPAGDTRALGARLAEASQGDLPSRQAVVSWASGRTWAAVGAVHRQLYARARRPQRPPKIRVVYLDHTAAASGGQLALARLLSSITDTVDPHVILGQEQGPYAQELRSRGISVETRPMSVRTRTFTKGRVVSSPSALLAAVDTAVYATRLALRLRRLKPDLVHTNSLKSGVYGGLACKLARVPLVWHLRDRLADDYLPRGVPGLLRKFIRNVAAGVVANSQTTADTLQSTDDSLPVAIAPSAVAVGTPREIEGRPIRRVGIVGRLVSWKGQDVFLRAFAHAFGGGSEIAVVVGGEHFGGPDSLYAESLTQLAVDLGIEDRVEFRGHVADVTSVLRDLDVLVHASTLPEPWGQVVIEGMAAGVPVIASNAGGPSEIISHGVDGLLVDPGDVRALSDAMLTLAGDVDLRRRLAAAATTRARDFSPEKSAATVTELYSHILRSEE